MERHNAVFHGQGAHTVHGLAGMEHTAVGLELGGVNAVGQGGGRGFGCGGGLGGFGGGLHGGGSRGCTLGGGGCGCAAARQQQGGQCDGCELAFFHGYLPVSILTYIN